MATKGRKKKRWSREGQANIRVWIMFISSLVILFRLSERGDEPGPFLTLLLAGMMGLGLIIAAVSNVLDKIPNREMKDDSFDSRARREEDGGAGGSEHDPGVAGKSGLRRSRLRLLPHKPIVGRAC